MALNKPGTREYRVENLNDMLNWSLTKKVNHAKKRIKEFYDAQDGQVYVAFSGGKDSTVLLHLVRSLYPEVKAVFSNTTNEYVEILEFVRTIDNCLTLNPKMTFKETIEKYGFPLVSKKTSLAISRLRENKSSTKNVRNLYMTGYNRKGVYCPTWKLAKKWYPLFEEAEFNITNKCCEVLKHKPMEEYQKSSGLKPFVGTQIEEGGFRKDSWLKEGCNIINLKTVTSRPISIWSVEDIWEYIKLNNIPYSKIYDDVIDDKTGEVKITGEKRTGCAYCAFGAHLEKSDLLNTNRFERLKLRKPKQYKKMMNLKNNGITFSAALDFIKVNH